MKNLTPNRRRFLQTSAWGAALFATPGLFAEQLAETSPVGEGPFYPDELPLDTDNDLLLINDAITPAVGEVTHLTGRVLTTTGQPMRNAFVEIWQCDANGVYHHPGDRRGPADPNFQGFGHTVAGQDGAYRFRTIVPVAYPGRTPHIHVKVLGAEVEALTTQMYVAGNPDNLRDGLYRRLGRAAELVTVELQPDGEGRRALFDIVLGPDGIPNSG
jgi:protocatechuate 3,4-dioxygenase beta subunit